MKRLVPIIMALLVAVPVMAQQYGSVAGSAVDNQKLPLPGVSVVLAGPAMQGPRTAVTDAQGRYRFIPVPPGKGYTLRFELQGFNTLEKTELTVSLGKEAAVDAEMSPAKFAETVTVTGDKIVVDTTKSTVETNVEFKLADTLSTSRHFNTIWYMTPGVPVAGVGSGQGQNNPSVHGAGGDSNAVLIDGVDTTDPRTQTWGTQINWDTIQEAQVQTGGYLAEFGRATGGIMNLVTKSGGNDFHGSVRVLERDSSWAAAPGLESERNGYRKIGGVTEKEVRPNATFGGPILKDTLWFYLGYERRNRDRDYSYYASEADLLAGTLSPVKSNYKGHESSAKLTFQLNASNSFVAYYNEDPINISNLDTTGGQYVSVSAQRTQFQGGNNYSAQWYGVLTPSIFMEAKYQYHHQELNAGPQGPGFGVDPSFYDRTYGYRSGAPITSYESARNRTGGLATASYFLDLPTSSHAFKAGVEYLDLKPNAGNLYNPVGDFQYTTNGSTGATTPARRYLYLDQLQGVRDEDTYLAIFVQDAWRIGSLTLNLGVRAEDYIGKTSAGNKVVDFGFGDQIAPRLGFAYDLKGDSIHGSVSRFYNMPTDYISAYMSENPGRQQRWNWKGGTGCPTTADPNWWNAPDSCWTLQYDLPMYAGGYLLGTVRPIYVDEATLGYDHVLSNQFAVGANLVWRQQKRTIDSIDPLGSGVYTWTNWPQTVTLPDGTVYPSNGYFTQYQGLELTVRKRYGPDGFQFMASFSHLFKAKGWPGSGGTTSSNSYTQWWGNCTDPDSCNPLWYGDTQSPNWVKFFGSWTAPWRTVFGLSGWWTSGNLYTRYVAGDFNNVPLEAAGSSRVGNNWEADVHIEQPVKVGPVDLAIYADVYNVFNNQQPIARNGNLAAVSYNLPTSWQTPRSFGVGFKLDF
jgi:outer membrane receptor for ferrienterochelin and colicin